MEIAIGGKALRDELGANHLAVAKNQAAGGLVRKQQTGESGHHQRVAQAEQDAVTSVKRTAVPQMECTTGPSCT